MGLGDYLEADDGSHGLIDQFSIYAEDLIGAGHWAYGG